MRRLALLLAIAIWPAAARAQFMTSGPDVDAEAGQNVDETDYRGRLMTSGVYYTESSDAVVDETMNIGDDPASDQTLVYTDLRGRVEAAHIGGSRWDVAGDFRLRLPADDLSSRGWLGGSESDLREAYALRRGRKVDVGLGRMIVRDLDATTIDGLKLVARPSATFELGAFAGLYPNPFSRSISDDYRRGRAPQDQPFATGAWAGYRTVRMYGSLGVAGILPRDDDPDDPEPTRAFVTANGYWRAASGFDIFHYAVMDLAGRGGTQLLNAQLGVHWRASAALVLEAGASHMSTYAIDLYVRSYLESPDTAPQPGRVQNNLFVARMAADEVRGGFNYLLKAQRVDVFGLMKWRKRATVASEELPDEIATLPADSQIDLSGGIRQRDSVAGLDLQLNVLFITGDRTSTQAATVRGRRAFANDRIEVEADVTYLSYEDACTYDALVAEERNCTGTADGSILEAGVSFVWRKDKNWLVLADYHVSQNDATAVQPGGMRTPEPTIIGHSLFARVQYSF
jgi:hypothetical protein